MSLRSGWGARCLVCVASLASAACAASPASVNEPSRESSVAPTSGDETSSAPPASVASTSAAPASAAPGGFDVTGRAQGNDASGFDVTARSDLPDTVPSTARPYNEIVEAAVASLRPALHECFATIPARATPRFYAVSVEPDGSVRPRTPQPVALPSRAAACAEALLGGTTVNPPPPRSFPFDLYVAIPSSAPDRSR